MAKLDLYKELKAEYVTPRQPVIVETTRAKYLAIDGEGDPSGEACIKRSTSAIRAGQRPRNCAPSCAAP